MRKIVLSCGVVGMIGLVWLAESRGGYDLNSRDLVYNPATRVYQHQSQGQFANQSLEQKLLTILFINRHQDQLASLESP
ncbi:MAG: hypothetical protein KKD63_00610 [Proteobacteria bacterium]|nr:hypothetical protein [Desulfobulbaceae bacterium]MBU4151359.1 hypothetical protein [Pseudomonadota bacterium]